MNELLIDAVGPMRDWFLGLGDWGVALWMLHSGAAPSGLLPSLLPAP